MDRIPALDGLRGVAILLVVVFHAWPDVLPAGGYGVTLFFVLSGFLITGIILRDIDQGGVNLRRFYWNRAVRLLPPLLLMVVVYLVVFGHWKPVVWTMTYASNFGQISGANLGRLSHTWSLAVEEHFYLLWPIALSIVRPRAHLKFAVWLLTVAVIWRLWITFHGDFSRVNLATDAVAFTLLAGCLLAVLHHRNLLPNAPEIATLYAVAGIVAAAFLVPEGSQEYLWVTFLVVGLSMIAVVGCLQGVGLLENRVLRWLGLVSYGLYLWHVPFLWSNFPLPRAALIGGALAVTWISYEFVEQPLRKRFHRSLRESPSEVGATTSSVRRESHA